MAESTGRRTLNHITSMRKIFGVPDDFEFSMFALLAIIIGGIVMMCLIVASGIVLYKKM